MKRENLIVLCFGCIGYPGHFLHSQESVIYKSSNPWGTTLDGGLLTEKENWRADTSPNGKWAEHHKCGWTAVSFWDRSGDSRGNSSTTFLVRANIDGAVLLEMAKQQWPQVFNRANFPKLEPKPFKIVKDQP